MTANDVLTLANKAMAARRRMIFYFSLMGQAKRENNDENFQEAEKSFVLFKEQFCTIMDCIAVVSRNAGQDFRYHGFGRCDI